MNTYKVHVYRNDVINENQEMKLNKEDKISCCFPLFITRTVLTSNIYQKMENIKEKSCKLSFFIHKSTPSEAESVLLL